MDRKITWSINKSLVCLCLWPWVACSLALATDPGTSLRVQLSWGHRSAAARPFYIKLLTNDVALTGVAGQGMERNDQGADLVWQTQAGGGDMDGVQFTVHYPERLVKGVEKLNSIWAGMLAQSDEDTVRRLKTDAGYRMDQRKITIQMDAAGTQGCSVTVDQLLQNHSLWVPSLDLYIATGNSPLSFAEHQRQLEPWQGQRILDQVKQQPEAMYEEYTQHWEDMGNPSYRHPSQPAPGHIVGLTWDSALYKYGIDREAGVWSDYGNPDRFRFWLEAGDEALAHCWKGQQLTDGLPVIRSTFEQAGLRYEIEQFAYPLDGPPQERRGDMAMVLLQRVTITNMTDGALSTSIRLKHRRVMDTEAMLHPASTSNPGTYVCEEEQSRRLFYTVAVPANTKAAIKALTTRERAWDSKETNSKLSQVTLELEVPEHQMRELMIKLPSPVVSGEERQKLAALDYQSCRKATLDFWSHYLAQGARFEAPEAAVNELYRANLWHALRLPRRHGGQEPQVKIDLPYSNFAYDQKGTPWPVNQAVYVDYMIYDLRGYHHLSAEELAVIYRNNQEPSGHVGGYANWGVYTPSMMYSVAQHYLLSHDRNTLERLLPATLKAMDWCLAEIKKGAQSEATGGLVRAPLNDLTGNGVWAFNQAYFYAGLERLGKVLAQIQHPRAQECATAAREFRQAIEHGFHTATMHSPLVQLRDHTWIPYVPCEARTYRRLMDQWYPTDVDTGATHLPRLKALAADEDLTEYLLQDHEDNLYLKGWGMANEPVYNQQATAYLLRDEPKMVIRAFYSMMACAFSHSVFEPVEHRWVWGQYYGPPSTDGAWFELYRHMLIHEQDDDTLLLLQATPRKWLEDGKQITIGEAPTYYGPLSLVVKSKVAQGWVEANLTLAPATKPKAIYVRIRHPESKPMRTVTVNGQSWNDFSVQKEWIRIPDPTAERLEIKVNY